MSSRAEAGSMALTVGFVTSARVPQVGVKMTGLVPTAAWAGCVRAVVEAEAATGTSSSTPRATRMRMTNLRMAPLRSRHGRRARIESTAVAMVNRVYAARLRQAVLDEESGVAAGDETSKPGSDPTRRPLATRLRRYLRSPLGYAARMELGWFSSDRTKHVRLATAWVMPEPSRCVQCGICSFHCPMEIDVRRHVWRGEPVVGQPLPHLWRMREALSAWPVAVRADPAPRGIAGARAAGAA